MKTLQRTRRLTAIATTLLVVVSARSLAASADADLGWEPALGREQGGLFSAGDRGSPLTYDSLLLSPGRTVYADLQRARQAALNEQATNLRVALREARDTLGRLRLPAQLTALAAQLQVIGNDLKDTNSRVAQRYVLTRNNKYLTTSRGQRRNCVTRPVAGHWLNKRGI